MKRITGFVISAALLVAAQTSMAYDGQVRKNGFSNEADALNAGKVVIQQINDGARTVAAAEVDSSCIPYSVDNMEAGQLNIEKHWISTGNGLEATFEAVVNYDYSCEEMPSL